MTPTTQPLSSAAEDAQDEAARLLTMPSALTELSLADARLVIGYTRVCRFAAGTTVILQGDSEQTDLMFLVLAGDVTVETITVQRANATVMTVLGPGNLIGEMGLLDGAPRAASCVADTEVTAAVLTRDDLSLLIRDHPAVAAKLLVAISQRMAARLRESTQKLRAYTQLTRVMQQEIESLYGDIATLSSGRGE
jgi:CRP/FNR family transcriptional regulator, cyclic AMP receptor protein